MTILAAHLSVWVARSAPLMRGLKHISADFRKAVEEGRRAIRPAYEGIETGSDTTARSRQTPSRRAIRPAYEGIETYHPVGVKHTWRPMSRDPPRL